MIAFFARNKPLVALEFCSHNLYQSDSFQLLYLRYINNVYRYINNIWFSSDLLHWHKQHHGQTKEFLKGITISHVNNNTIPEAQLSSPYWELKGKNVGKRVGGTIILEMAVKIWLHQNTRFIWSAYPVRISYLD